VGLNNVREAAPGAVRCARPLVDRGEFPSGTIATIQVPYTVGVAEPAPQFLAPAGLIGLASAIATMTAARAIIADDERLMREQLRARLTEVWPELEVVAEAKNGQEAVEAGAAVAAAILPFSTFGCRV